MKPATCRTLLAAVALLATSSALGASFPHTPEARPVPAVGTTQAMVVEQFGQPTSGIASQLFGATRIDVWDFGTFRVFMRDGKVLESRRW